MDIDRRTEERVQDWLRDGDTQIPDHVLRDVLHRTQTTPQARRRLLGRLFGRDAGARRRPDYDHPPDSQTRRNRLMFSATSVMATVAVLAIGASIVTTPQSPPGAAQAEVAAPQPPAEFDGTVSCGREVSLDRAGSGEILQLGDEATVLTSFRQTYDPPFERAEPIGDEATLLARFYDGAWRHSATMSDPRLEGAWYRTHEYDAYRTAGSETGPALIVNTLRIENDEGAWSGSSIVVELAAGPGTQLVGDTPMVLVGEDAYEGLTAILTTLPSAVQGCSVDTRGVIFDDAPAASPYLPLGG